MKRSGVEPVRRLVLDTSAYSQMRAGRAHALDLVAAAEVVFLPVVAIGELEAGFEFGRHTAENRVLLAEFLAEPFVAVSIPATNRARVLSRAGI